MKSLSETSVFKYSELMIKITSFLKNIVSEKHGAVYPTEEQFEDVFYKIRHKSFNYAGKFAIIDLYRKGIIRLLYNDEAKLTVAVPFFKYKMSNGGFGVIVNISNYAKLDDDGNVKIDPLTLYTLMLSGAFSLVENNNVSLLANNGLVELYSELMLNVINKLVNVDQVRKEMYKFIFAKFMYIQLGISEDRASAAAKTIVKLDQSTAESVDLSCPTAVFTNLETLIDHLKNIFTDTSNLTLGIVFDKWMRSYGEAAAFAIENISMFNMLFIALITNSNSLVNIKAIEKSANRHSSKLVTLFNKMENIVMDMV